VQREGVVANVPRMWVGAVLEQKPNGLRMMHGDMKTSRALIALVHKTGPS
jgi:hypothetical protein